MPFYQSNDTKTYSTAPGTPISVIAAFNTEGGIKLLRIRLDGLNDHIEANIDKVLSSRKLIHLSVSCNNRRCTKTD